MLVNFFLGNCQKTGLSRHYIGKGRNRHGSVDEAGSAKVCFVCFSGGSVLEPTRDTPPKRRRAGIPDGRSLGPSVRLDESSDNRTRLRSSVGASTICRERQGVFSDRSLCDQ